jgi:PIN domain nuclease of toxin-antitoxin system
MAAVVTDTHSILWYLAADPKLSKRAVEALDAATEGGYPIYVPAICLVELVYLIEKNRLPAIARERQALDDSDRPPRLVPMDRAVVDAVEIVSRNDVPDMLDRIVAATALSLQIPLVSRDAGFALRKFRPSGRFTSGPWSGSVAHDHNPAGGR